MSSFSSILSSIGQTKQAAQQAPTSASNPTSANQQPRPPPKLANGSALTANNTVAGVKRRSEEPAESGPRPKSARTTSAQDVSSPHRALARPAAPPQRQQAATTSAKPLPSRPQAPSLVRNPSSKSTTITPPTTANGPPPPKRGFASIMDKAKAAQAAAQAAGPSTIKHQATVKHLSRRDRLKAVEEAKADAKANRRGGARGDRSRSNTPVGVTKSAPRKMAAGTESGYKGTMKSAVPAASQPTYKGTMRAAGAGPAAGQKSKPGTARSRQDEYVEWDEMEEEDDCGEGEDDQGGYGSDASSDMEGGFDDVEREEVQSRRLAQKEDHEALAEEDRLKREKEERRRRLASLSKAAAGKRKY